MSEKITERINNNLSVIYNIENDDIYNSIICDKDGIIAGTISRPDDIELGAITSQIEYLRILSHSLVDQLYIDQATGLYLKYVLENFFNSIQLPAETESAWIAREIALIFQPRISVGSIISALTSYSDPAPLVERLGYDSGFADRSFADIYDTYVTTYEGDDFYVFSAKSSEFGSSFFSITITMYNFTGRVNELINIINAYIAAGITYTLKFETV